MSTTFAAFVSTGVTLAYTCVRLSNLCPHEQVSQTFGCLKAIMGGSGKILDSLEFFLTFRLTILGNIKTTNTTDNFSRNFIFHILYSYRDITVSKYIAQLHKIQ